MGASKCFSAAAHVELQRVSKCSRVARTMVLRVCCIEMARESLGYKRSRTARAWYRWEIEFVKRGYYARLHWQAGREASMRSVNALGCTARQRATRWMTKNSSEPIVYNGAITTMQ